VPSHLRAEVNERYDAVALAVALQDDHEARQPADDADAPWLCAQAARKELALRKFIRAAIYTGMGEFIELLNGIKSAVAYAQLIPISISSSE